MPSVRADIEQIQAAADRAARITKQLLIVGRRQTTKPAAIELNAVLANSRDLLASAVGAAIDTGLGLATVYGIVTGAGGGISVDSEEGTGTTFRIFFPAIALPTPVTEATDATPDAQGHGETILVVDDEPPVLHLTSRILRQNGYVTLEAVTFEEASSLASSHDLQLLLTDSVLPHMSGETLAQRVTALRPGLPVMFMSGYSRDMLNPRHARAEGTRFVQKPFIQRTLLEKVHAALAAPTSATPNEP
jgi:two-component system, cell cycle sensor histidine kinase and response regulator CckA